MSFVVELGLVIVKVRLMVPRSEMLGAPNALIMTGGTTPAAAAGGWPVADGLVADGLVADGLVVDDSGIARSFGDPSSGFAFPDAFSARSNPRR